MSATLPIPPPTTHPARHPWRAALALLAYVVILVAVFARGPDWLGELAVVLLASLLLSPGLKRQSVAAIALWILIAAGVVALAAGGEGALALDFVPVIVNAALCMLFARTLAKGSEPLVARVIAILEGPERIALPRVRAYARALTYAWALLLGAQALVLTALIACAVPEGLLAHAGIAPPLAVSGAGWRWYLHFGSYASVIAFFVAEYVFRRVHLSHIPHPSLPVFAARLASCWPALARSVVDDVPTRSMP